MSDPPMTFGCPKRTTNSIRVSFRRQSLKMGLCLLQKDGIGFPWKPNWKAFPHKEPIVHVSKLKSGSPCLVSVQGVLETPCLSHWPFRGLETKAEPFKTLAHRSSEKPGLFRRARDMERPPLASEQIPQNHLGIPTPQFPPMSQRKAQTSASAPSDAPDSFPRPPGAGPPAPAWRAARRRRPPAPAPAPPSRTSAPGGALKTAGLFEGWCWRPPWLPQRPGEPWLHHGVPCEVDSLAAFAGISKSSSHPAAF